MHIVVEYLEKNGTPNHRKIPRMHKSHADTLHALSEINEKKFKELESFLTFNVKIVKNLTCCRSDCYKQLQIFQLLPGHKAIIMVLPDQMKNMESKKTKRKHEQSMK